MKKIFYVFSFLICFSFVVDNSLKVDHEIWNKLLSKHVNEQGKVDYVGFNSSKQELTIYLTSLKNNPPTDTWTKQEAMAYWINVYNSNTVKLILNHYPIESIMEINDGKAWDLKFIEIGGKNYSLNNIEHDILRKQYPDPRIHFAVNCAAKSCPKLNNEAFTAKNLETSLARLTKEFINNNSKNNLTSSPIQVSQLFNWYKDDFARKGTIIDYINNYAVKKLDPSTKVVFKEYSWDLNN